MVAAKANQYQDPTRCTSVLQLWEALSSWEQLGAEVLSGGYPLRDWLRATALDKLIPEELLKTVVGRPELQDYHEKLKWVRAQMEHAKSQAQMMQVGAPTAKHPKKDDEMDVGNLDEDGSSVADAFLANLQLELFKCTAVGDWASSEGLQKTIY